MIVSANGNASEHGSTELNGSIIPTHPDQTDELGLIVFQFSILETKNNNANLCYIKNENST